MAIHDSPAPVALSWSGGKDSALTLAALRADPSVEVVALLTSVTLGYDRISIHGVRRSLLRAQARAAGLPLQEIVLQPRSSNAHYDQAVSYALDTLRQSHPRLRTVAYGDLFLEDVRRYREERLGPLGFAGSCDESAAGRHGKTDVTLTGNRTRLARLPHTADLMSSKRGQHA